MLKEGIVIDPIIRGSIEKHIDRCLGEEKLDAIADWFKSEYRGIIFHNLNDALFGFVVGSAFSYFVGCLSQLGSPPEDDDINESYQIIQRRATEIKGKIDYVLGKSGM